MTTTAMTDALALGVEQALRVGGWEADGQAARPVIIGTAGGRR
ncbi:hypothetical protein [Streptomyces sp. NPDC093060]